MGAYNVLDSTGVRVHIVYCAIWTVLLAAQVWLWRGRDALLYLASRFMSLHAVSGQARPSVQYGQYCGSVLCATGVWVHIVYCAIWTVLGYGCI